MAHTENSRLKTAFALTALISLFYGCSFETESVEESSAKSRKTPAASVSSHDAENDSRVIAVVGDSVIDSERVLLHYEQLRDVSPWMRSSNASSSWRFYTKKQTERGNGRSGDSGGTPKGMVREFLYAQMVENHGNEAIREDDYEFWYRRAYARFVHEDGYFATDAQFVCCQESELEKCIGDPEVETCFDAHAPIMQWVHSQLVERGPYPSKEAFQETVTQLAGEVGGHSATCPDQCDLLAPAWRSLRPTERLHQIKPESG